MYYINNNNIHLDKNSGTFSTHLYTTVIARKIFPKTNKQAISASNFEDNETRNFKQFYNVGDKIIQNILPKRRKLLEISSMILKL